MFYYVGVNTPEGLALVTSVNTTVGSIDFKPFKRPICFTAQLADSVRRRLVDELFLSVVLISDIEFDNQPFLVHLW